MREVTKLMINEFKIKKLGYDFMGYSLQKGDIYTFHHLIVPNRNGGAYARWNGAILFSTPHEYLHTIEAKDYDMYLYINNLLTKKHLSQLYTTNSLFTENHEKIKVMNVGREYSIVY